MKAESIFIEIPVYNSDPVIINTRSIIQVIPLSFNEHCIIYYKGKNFRYVETTLSYQELADRLNAGPSSRY